MRPPARSRASNSLLLVLCCGGALLLALARPSGAAAESYAVGVLPGWSAAKLADRIEATTGSRAKTLLPGAALEVDAPRAALENIRGVGFVEVLGKSRKLAFTTNDPLAPKQWYLTRDKAWDFWPTFPKLATVKVAVIDSGIDGGHPEFPTARIAGSKSFVGGSPLVDTDGHGTFVAGEIAAQQDNGIGIAGLAFPAQLLIAKVVGPDGELTLRAEVAAIKWAVAEHASVINLSLGGVRDPLDRKLDTYSPLEQAAVDYAFRHNAVVVGAVGNGPQSPHTPWPYAHYPAALPHVIGVSAVTQTGAVPAFSNRDQIYNDIAAPGENILSTIPREMTATRPSCADQGYSPCGPDEFSHAIGTSFAAPQVSAAAALVRSVRPDLHPEQVAALLERTADDANPSTGCSQCPLLRDEFTGWGTLNVQRALQVATAGGAIPPPDRFETNDGAGAWAYPMWGAKGRTVRATLDYWDDQVDVYAVVIRKGQRLYARLNGPGRAGVVVVLWRPGTREVDGLSAPLSQRAALSARVGRQERLAFTARRGGTYFLEVKLQTPGSGSYTLSFSKATPKAKPKKAHRAR
ncbi:MAG TPA: S8 family serine peptidase [Gaiellaceae bacterium]|nr:S8 family serine peptidase [Gaiellaceae bacterium]